MSTAEQSFTKNHDGGDTIVCKDPATGRVLGEVPAMSRAEVVERIRRARLAHETWRTASFEERRRVLRDLLAYTLEHADEIAELVVLDSGKTREHAMVGEIWPVAEKLRWTVAEGEKHLVPEHVSSGLLVNKRALVEFHPLGVVGVISPWNFPFQNILGPTIAALFAGNGVVIKVSEWSSWSAARIQRMFDEVLNARGHSPDLVQILTGRGETGAAVVSGGSDLIIFTGSARNGRRVIEESAKNIVPVILELGGKDPMIVCDDAHVPQAVHTALAGAFLSAGQMCMAIERVYAFEAIHDEFVRQVVAVAKDLRQRPHGSEITDVGAMTMPAQIDLVERLVNDAVAKGAVVHCGGKRSKFGQYFEPTVLTNVTHEMAIMKEETFGPVMCIVKVKDEEEAIRMANDSEFALGSSVFTKSVERARRIAHRVAAGSMCQNDFGLAYLAQDLPFGGAKRSGFGRLNGRDGLRACTNQKAVLEDRIPIYTPKKLFPAARGDYELARSAIKVIYGGWKQRAIGVRDMATTLAARLTGGRS
jgi:acyl-CoA reductase-like NAD-dependent aldehyde dehydrogenase